MDFDDRLQPRDLDVINFINTVKVTTRNQIQKAIFKNLHPNVSMRRLSFLVDGSYINRTRYKGVNCTNGYIYYPSNTKKHSKKLLAHDLIVSDVYATMLSASIDVLEFKPTYIIGNIIADAYVKYRGTDGIIRRAFIEVQRRSPLSDCVNKYSDIKSIIIKEKNWGSCPRLIVVSDLDDEKVTLRNINVNYIGTDLKNIRSILF